MELIRSTHTNYDEYESLLLERDQAQKEAGQAAAQMPAAPEPPKKDKKSKKKKDDEEE